MCKHKFEVDCVHIYKYLLSIKGIKSIDTDGLKNIGDVFNRRCTRVTCHSMDVRYSRGKHCIFIDFEDGRVLTVREG